MGKYLCFSDSRYSDGHPGDRILLLHLGIVPILSADPKNLILSLPLFLPFSLLFTTSLQKPKTAKLE